MIKTIPTLHMLLILMLRRGPYILISFFISINITACKYEAEEQTDTNKESISQYANSQGNNVDGELVLPEIPQCDGICTCDETLIQFNDTGVIESAESSTGNLSYCSFSILLGQDCRHGRDSQTSLNKVGKGNAGFDYSKVSSEGNILSEDTKEWQCVLDNHTGLMWEVKEGSFSSNMGKKTNTFSWFDDDFPDYSSANNGDCNLSTSCDTQTYIQTANINQMCGFDDWRLPDKIELQDLVDYGNSIPSIDSFFFPQTESGFYWTSSVDSDDLASVWQVGFHFGRVAGNTTNNAKYIRLVRNQKKQKIELPIATTDEKNPIIREIVAPRQRCNSQIDSSAPISRFKQDHHGNILDRFSGLIWKRCVAGLSGNYCDEGEKLKMSWLQAQMYAGKVTNDETEVLTTSWRLPNIKELQSTIEIQCEEPALNPFIFPNIPLEDVWSGTPHTHHTDSSYYLQYQNSIIFYAPREEQLLVHLVRDCQ